MGDIVIDIIKSTGYVGILLLMLAENVFPPIPSELVMPLAGYWVAKEQLALWGVILCGSLGAMAGAVILYLVGAKLGQERLKTLAAHHGRWLAISPQDIDKTHHWFDKYGHWTVLLFRLVPGMRSLISVPAGVVNMPWLKFSVYTFIGTFIWTALLTFVGIWLGENFEEAEKYLGPVSTTVVVALVALYVYRVVKGSGKSPESSQPAEA